MTATGPWLERTSSSSPITTMRCSGLTAIGVTMWFARTVVGSEASGVRLLSSVVYSWVYWDLASARSLLAGKSIASYVFESCDSF